jgi:hypothetical protein
MAGIDTAARHAHIDKVSWHRLTSDLTLIWFGHLISAPLEVSY